MRSPLDWVAAPSGGLRSAAAIRHDLTTKKLGMSTVIALRTIDSYVATIRRSGSQPDCLLDLGSKWGTLGAYISAGLDIGELMCVDRYQDALDAARQEGAATLLADLGTDLPLPLEDRSVGVITSFGVTEHLQYYDDYLDEVHRLLVPGGWFMLSMPNLGSYLNRAGLLLGYQPRDIEIARRSTPGVMPFYRGGARRPLGHPHVGTVRAMVELLQSCGFEIVRFDGFGPRTVGYVRFLDRIFNRIPTLSRRILILARRSPSIVVR